MSSKGGSDDDARSSASDIASCPRDPQPQRLHRALPGHGAPPALPRALRYRFYTSAADIDADLRAWLRFYNFERPHRGHRTKGRRPAEMFYADAPALLVMKGWDLDEFTSQTVRS